MAAVGDFSTILLDINPTLVATGYPQSFTLETVTISGLTAPVDGRVALRYFVTQGGVNGANSNIIGVDSFSTTAAVPRAFHLRAGRSRRVVLLGIMRARRQPPALDPLIHHFTKRWWKMFRHRFLLQTSRGLTEPCGVRPRRETAATRSSTARTRRNPPVAGRR